MSDADQSGRLYFCIHQVQHPLAQRDDGGPSMFGLRRLLHHTQLNDSPHILALLKDVAPWISLGRPRNTPLPAPIITTPPT